MPEANNLGNVRAWLRACPEIPPDRAFGADFLGEDPDKFALSSIPSVLKFRRNILGQRLTLPVQEQQFALDYRAHFGEQAAGNLENLSLFQALHNWILAQNNAGNFPDWIGGEVDSVVPTLTPALMDTQSATARYRIQISVTYHIESEV